MENLEEKVMKTLEKVIDPDFRVDIVNLGFINQVQVDEQGICHLNMTLTVIGCPIMSTLEDMVKEALAVISEIKNVEIDYTWEPAWSVDRMTPYAKAFLGLT